MGRAVLLALVVIGTALLVFWLAGLPRPAPISPSSSAPVETTASGSGTGSSEPSLPLEAPRSHEQQERDALETRRRPFYSRLREEGGAYLSSCGPASDDADTLELSLAVDSDTLVDEFTALIARLNAYHYGFRHARFYLPNPPGIAERQRLAAEASPTDNGGWIAIRK